MKIFTVLLFLVCLLFNPVFSSNIEVQDNYDFKLALSYAFQNGIDTLILVTDGGVYTTQDTVYFQITEPVVIMAKPGLTEKPVFTHSDPDSDVIEIFRIHDDVEFNGIIFQGDHPLGTYSGKYAVRFGHGPDDQIPRVYAKEGTHMTFRNCEFKNMYPPGYENDSGGIALYFLRPAAGEPIIKAGNVIIEDCIFRNLGDEAIRIAETEKYVVERVVDTLIVRNSTFKNISAECIRFYADADTSNNTDAYVLIEHLTIDSSATRTAYIKNNKGTQFRDVIISNSILPKPYRQDRADYLAEVQTKGSQISHCDSFNITFGFNRKEDSFRGTKGASVDTTTIYGLDPQYTDADHFDYTLLPTSPMYGKAYSGAALGDLRWVDPTVGIFEENAITIPEEHMLQQNFPNPFNPSTNITFTISQNSHVKIDIYDMNGKLVDELVNRKMVKGTYSTKWMPANIASGVYFYKLTAGEHTAIKKMTLMK